MTGGNDRPRRVQKTALYYLALLTSCAVGAMTAAQNLPTCTTNALRLKQVAKTSSPCSPEIWLLEFFIDSSICSKLWCSNMPRDLTHHVHPYNPSCFLLPSAVAPSEPSFAWDPKAKDGWL